VELFYFYSITFVKLHFSIACRGSWLSLAQAQLFIAKVQQVFSTVNFTIKVVQTAGDKEQNTPLHLVEGKDFFTKEIQHVLNNNEADFAIHSMKDVSSLNFFNDGHYAIFDRALLHDVAIFNPSVLHKLENGEKIIVGTSSPRRSNMATGFLQKALPVLNNNKIIVEAQSIRGNVDTRLQKLHNGEYDGIILAAAGLNRLLQYVPAQKTINSLLAHKKIMLLPLFECPPAAGQGAIVAETQKDNTDAITILDAINNAALTEGIKKERVYAQQYGYGCSQQFGVFNLQTANTNFTYASGKTDTAGEFTHWGFDTPLQTANKNIFSSADYMKQFFAYDFFDEVPIDDNATTFFISSYKVVHSQKIKDTITNKQVWASGTKTWYSLAKQGIWVSGCADGLGFNFLQQVFTSPLFKVDVSRLQILTNKASAQHWQQDGFNAAYTYALLPSLDAEVKDKIAEADIIFWTSYQQYQTSKTLVKKDVVHACPSGKTAQLLTAEGLQPVVFPTIKAFIFWVSGRE
jgi:hydroxymethylbilane synthase